MVFVVVPDLHPPLAPVKVEEKGVGGKREEGERRTYVVSKNVKPTVIRICLLT